MNQTKEIYPTGKIKWEDNKLYAEYVSWTVHGIDHQYEWRLVYVR